MKDSINYQLAMKMNKKNSEIELKNFRTLLIKKMKNISMHLT